MNIKNTQFGGFSIGLEVQGFRGLSVKASLIAILITVIGLLTPARAAYLELPVRNKVYTNNIPVLVQGEGKEISRIDLYRSFPGEESHYYRTFINWTGGGYYEIPLDEITCGEYIMVVFTTDPEDELAVSDLFFVLNERVLIKFLYPDADSTAGAGSKVLIRAKYYGDHFTPNPDSFQVCVVPPKANPVCDNPPDGIEKFGVGDKVKWRVPVNPAKGLYEIRWVQADHPENCESTTVMVDPQEIVGPSLQMSMTPLQGYYAVSLSGNSPPYNWALEYSFDGVHWFAYWERWFRPGMQITLLSSASALFVRFRLH